MTQGLYEILGADRTADHPALHQAYTRSVASITRRRRALVEQGGDTRMIDLARAQVDEAWAILADPARRRRYDALATLTAEGDLPPATELWERVSGSLVSPAAAAAVELLRALTRLDLGSVPFAPGSTSPPDEEPTWAPDTQADVPTQSFAPEVPVARSEREARRERDVWLREATPGRTAATPSAPVVRLPVIPEPRLAEVRAEPRVEARGEPRVELRLVEGKPAATPVIRMPEPEQVRSLPPEPEPPAFDLDAAVGELGWTGGLLRRVREERAMSLRDLGEATRITARYLEAIEGDLFDQLPSSTFVKGYLREIARVLQLDEAALVKGYMRRMS